MQVKSSNPVVIYVVGALFVVVIAFVIYSFVRRREEVFEGEVIDKDIIENQATNYNRFNSPGTINFGNQGGVTHSYRIRVKTDQGKEISYTISAGKYEIIKIGDRVSKPKGTTEVTIISSVPTPPTNQTPPVQPPAQPTPPIGPLPPQPLS